jgi:signal transduction histidine kinase/CheY-like chemotaxis protein
VLGTLTVGYALDDELARSLAEVTHCEINLVAGGRLYASSLGDPDRAALVAAVADGRWPGDADAGTVQQIGDGRYTLGAFPLALQGGEPSAGRLLLLDDWTSTEAFLAQLRWSLLGAGLIIFTAAIGMAVFFSRRIGRPLEDLAAAAQDIAGGNWARQLPVRGTAEEVAMSQAVNTMTTSLRHWYEEAKARDDQLRQAQKLEALGRLAGGVAHDFNNFLTAIKGYGDLLMEATAPKDPQRSKIEGILKAADTAAGLTRQLLAFSRRRVVAVRPVSIVRLLSETERMLRRLIGEQIVLTTSVAPGTGCVKADPNQLEQVLLNLAVNARDAMSGAGTIAVDLDQVLLREPLLTASPTLDPGLYVRLTVRDSGCGMTDQVKARIFEPFFTTKPEGSGTGLGLSMVYGIVEQLGGGIVVDTAPGHGTAFAIYLPHTSEAEPAATPPTAAPAPGGSETVLLVEDEPQLATLIARVLRKNGYTVLQAAQSEEALAILQSHGERIDLLLTDVVMPGMNGRELAERVKLERADIRVLFMSGYSDDAVLRHGVEAAIAHFLPKPFSMQTLTAKVREVLSPTVHAHA